MEVPCCGGVNAILRNAMTRAGVSVPVQEYVLGVDGNVIDGRVAV
jgi:hypothetical protein